MTSDLKLNERFGEVRSAIQQPSELAWARLCDLLDRLEADGVEHEVLREQLMPYVEASLRRWPEAHRLAPHAWIARVTQGEAPPLWWAMPARLDLTRHILSPRSAKRLAGSGLGHIRELTIDLMCTAEALDQLLEATGDGLRALSIPQPRNDQLIRALTERAPRELERLEVPHITARGAQRLLPTLISLRSLTIYDTPADEPLDAWTEAFSSELAGRLRALHVPTKLNPLRALAQAASQGGLGALRSLTLPSVTPAIAPAHPDANDCDPFLITQLANMLSGCEGLEELRLGAGLCPSLKQLKATLGPSARLRALELGPTGQRHDHAARELLDGLPELRALTIHDNSPWRSTPTQPAALSMLRAALRMPRLEALSLTLGHAALPSDLEPSEASRLHTLSLARLATDDRTCDKLVATLQALTTLEITHARLNAATIRAMLDAASWPHLKTLRLHDTRADDEAAELLAKLPEGLATLSLANSPTLAQHLHTLFSYSPLSSLQRLDLSRCAMDAPTLDTLISSLDLMPSLHTLELGYNALTERQAHRLLSSPSIAQLQRLGLNGCNLSRASRAMLRDRSDVPLLTRDLATRDP